MMTDDNRKRSSKPYDVGYGKPPVETRWQPGQPSPNRTGRPKKAEPTPKSIAEAAAAAACKLIKVRKGGKVITITIADAIFAKLGFDAANGDKRAADLLFKYCPAADLAASSRTVTVEDLKNAGSEEEAAKIYERLMGPPSKRR